MHREKSAQVHFRTCGALDPLPARARLPTHPPARALYRPQVLQYGAKSANIITEEPIDMVLHESYPNR